MIPYHDNVANSLHQNRLSFIHPRTLSDCVNWKVSTVKNINMRACSAHYTHPQLDFR